ncbi:Macrolide export protein MacA [Maioricimonas rarisocia]|uniref:Macrolide export protein MacA n=1 Tax=Maioricimonas rarisocia TaxID=2528026 RepID=A0A517ZD56_9PLAN|nr:efflux RND transporter periplasmic adaptor subunit [Maioricimonas rarisocia]QDU40370.1 Macrolide export protein MacA [Maioricimonas rarisocia]
MTDVQTQRFRGGADSQRNATSGPPARYLIAAGVAILVLVAAVSQIPSATTAGESESTASSNRLLPVRTIELTSITELETRHTFTGVVEPARTSQLGFERSGRVLELLVDEGERVEADQPLARLDTQALEIRSRELEAKRLEARAILAELRRGPREETIAAARANVEQFQAELELWTVTCSRNDRLRQNDAITEQQYDNARLNMSAARARLSAAKSQLRELEEGTRQEQLDAQDAVVAQLDANLALVETDLEKSVLRAPFAGTISKRLIDEGTVTSATATVFELVDTDHLEARIGLPADVASRLQPGQEKGLRKGTQHLAGRIRAVRPVLDPVTRTQVVIIDIVDDASRQTVPGEVVRLDITETGDADGFWVPLSALAQGPRGLWSLYAVDPASADAQAAEANNARVERRTVEVVHTEEDQALVRGTVYDGDRIVVNGLHRIVPGQLVRVVDDSIDGESPSMPTNLKRHSG